MEELEGKDAITVTELVSLLNTSESTIRRDLTTLNNMGKLNKVHGGATKLESNYTIEEDVPSKCNINIEEKNIIAKYAASLIDENDFVYIDAGTTTEIMIDYIIEKRATYITNGIVHAKKLAQKGFMVFVLGGELKFSTEAIIGVEAISSLCKYNFTKGFFGTNGISEVSGFSTPDVKEALVKEEALKRSGRAYILSDSSKFNKISCVTFAKIDSAVIITTKLKNKKIEKYTQVMEVEEI